MTEQEPIAPTGEQRPDEELLSRTRDPKETEHPAGEAQAARNIAEEPAG